VPPGHFWRATTPRLVAGHFMFHTLSCSFEHPLSTQTYTDCSTTALHVNQQMNVNHKMFMHAQLNLIQVCVHTPTI